MSRPTLTANKTHGITEGQNSDYAAELDIDPAVMPADAPAADTKGTEIETTSTMSDNAESKTNTSTAENERQYIDGGYGWVIVACCFLLNMIMDGLINAFGVIYIEVLEKFGTTSAEAAWILSIQVCVHGFVGPAVIALKEVVGTRVTTIIGTLLIAVGFLGSAFATNVYVLYVTIGLIAGLGFGVYEKIGMALVNHYFEKRRGIANGITASGTGVGLLVFPPLANYMFSEYGYTGTCIVLSGIALQGVVAGALLLPPESVIRLKKSNSKKQCKVKEGVDNKVFQISMDAVPVTKQENCKESPTSNPASTESTLTFKARLRKTILSSCDIKLFKNINFACFALTHCLFSGSFLVPSAFMPARAVSFGISKTYASLLISVMGVSSLVTRPISGLLVDVQPIKRNRFYVFFAMVAMCGCVTIVNFGQSLESQMTFAVLYGISTGGYISLITMTLGDLIGVEKLMPAYGLASMCMTLPCLLIPSAAGFIFDASGRYDYVYAFGGSILLLSAVALIPIPIAKACRSNSVHINSNK